MSGPETHAACDVSDSLRSSSESDMCSILTPPSVYIYTAHSPAAAAAAAAADEMNTGCVLPLTCTVAV